MLTQLSDELLITQNAFEFANTCRPFFSLKQTRYPSVAWRWGIHHKKYWSLLLFSTQASIISISLPLYENLGGLKLAEHSKTPNNFDSMTEKQGVDSSVLWFNLSRQHLNGVATTISRQMIVNNFRIANRISLQFLVICFCLNPNWDNIRGEGSIARFVCCPRRFHHLAATSITDEYPSRL